MIHKFSLRETAYPEPDLHRLRTALTLDDLEMWRDYYVEFAADPGDGGRAALAAALADGVGTVVEIDAPFRAGDVSVAHRSGIVDNESDSLVALCTMLGLTAHAGKVATTYRSASADLATRVRRRQYNATIEELHEADPGYRTLRPSGAYRPAERVDLRPLTDEELAAAGRAQGRNLSLPQMQHIRGIQQRLHAPYVTDVLLEAMDARWSDHCAHTTWRSLGNLLHRLVAASTATANPNIVSMFHDNAGVWDFYDGQALAIKAETHNGPSAISAYFGQLTKIGGVLRDILGTGLGADPIGCFEYTATGLPEAPAPAATLASAHHIANDTIRAVKEYANTFGVPMMWSHMTFHPAYRAKPFALGGSVGVLPTSAAERGRPRPGDLVVLIGGRTGNEGIHGASASSAGSNMDEAAVQIGAPVEQVTFRKAIIELRDAGCLRALTDVGGAGLNSAVGEIGEACGVWINTALVPLKTSAMPMWRILLSESQERMLLAVPPEQDAAARAILRRHGVRTTVIGRFTDTGRYAVFHRPDLDEATVAGIESGRMPDDVGELGFDVPYDILDCPVPSVTVAAPPRVAAPDTAWPALSAGDLADLFARVAADAEVTDQRFADSQYDSTVQGRTWHGPRHGVGGGVPTGYWAGTPIPGSPAAAVLSTAFNPWLAEADPVGALRQAFLGVVAGQVLAGVDLCDICLCDNFYTPHLGADAYPWLAAMVDELAMLVRRFGVPVISGKDSSAGSTSTDEGIISVPPGVFLTALGKVPHVDRLLPEQWSGAGTVLVRIGPATAATAGTVAARVLGLPAAGVDQVELAAMERFLAALPASRPLVRSGTRIGPGGVAAQLLQGVLASGLGVDLDPAAATAEALFAEHRCGALVEVGADDVAGLAPELNPVRVGVLNGSRGIRAGAVDLLTPAVERAYSESFEARLA